MSFDKDKMLEVCNLIGNSDLGPMTVIRIAKLLQLLIDEVAQFADAVGSQMLCPTCGGQGRIPEPVPEAEESTEVETIPLTQSPEQETEGKKQCGHCHGLARVRNQHREMVNCPYCGGRGEVAI